MTDVQYLGVLLAIAVLVVIGLIALFLQNSKKSEEIKELRGVNRRLDAQVAAQNATTASNVQAISALQRQRAEERGEEPQPGPAPAAPAPAGEALGGVVAAMAMHPRPRREGDPEEEDYLEEIAEIREDIRRESLRGKALRLGLRQIERGITNDSREAEKAKKQAQREANKETGAVVSPVQTFRITVVGVQPTLAPAAQPAETGRQEAEQPAPAAAGAAAQPTTEAEATARLERLADEANRRARGGA